MFRLAGYSNLWASVHWPLQQDSSINDDVLRYRSAAPSQVHHAQSAASIRRPSNCLHCGAVGTVHLEHTIQGEQIQLHWYCSNCEAEWAGDT